MSDIRKAGVGGAWNECFWTIKLKCKLPLVILLIPLLTNDLTFLISKQLKNFDLAEISDASIKRIIWLHHQLVVHYALFFFPVLSIFMLFSLQTFLHFFCCLQWKMRSKHPDTKCGLSAVMHRKKKCFSRTKKPQKRLRSEAGSLCVWHVVSSWLNVVIKHIKKETELLTRTSRLGCEDWRRNRWALRRFNWFPSVTLIIRTLIKN